MVNNPPANAENVRDMDWIPESGKAPGGRHGDPLYYSCLEKPHGRKGHRLAKSQTLLSIYAHPYNI